MVKLPQTIFRNEIEKARERGLHEIPKGQFIKRFQLEGYGLEKAKKWVNELMDLCMELEETGPYIKF